MKSQLWAVLATVVSLGPWATVALDGSDLDSIESTKRAAAAVAQGAVKYYKGDQPGQTVGILPEPYFWWQSGAMLGTLVDYWHYTGDSTYNNLAKEGMLSQKGEQNDFQPASQLRNLANDDQAMWALAALSAAEFSFDAPGSDQLQWVDLAKNTFEAQVRRWDNEKCGGGLNWQVNRSNNPTASYKNSMANGAFFELSSRLARYTKNGTYLDWATKTWDWMSHVGLLTKDFKVFDGTDAEKDCKQLNHFQWSINVGILLSGAANLYNTTNGDPTWKTRVEGLLKSTDEFFSKNVMIEPACEANKRCNLDHKIFKVFLSRALGTTVKLAHFAKAIVLPKITASSRAAVEKCENENGIQRCSFHWLHKDDDTDNDRDESDGNNKTLGEQLSTLQIILASLAARGDGSAPVTQLPTGKSQGDESQAEILEEHRLLELHQILHLPAWPRRLWI
uniref:Mannan endo-1,6-alpha-mannosidase n=1 Tax=Paracoccidioides brasiliensis TaxID=121759 RepID=Q7Z8P3_PARBR|nr:DFG5-like protein [Paracoccidioides brasiliensis]ABF93408.1 DFG5-like protein [Paracoccidioides brasiliensis]